MQNRVGGENDKQAPKRQKGDDGATVPIPTTVASPSWQDMERDVWATMRKLGPGLIAPRVAAVAMLRMVAPGSTKSLPDSTVGAKNLPARLASLVPRFDLRHG